MAKNEGKELAWYHNMLRKYQLDESTFFAETGVPEGLPPLQAGAIMIPYTPAVDLRGPIYLSIYYCVLYLVLDIVVTRMRRAGLSAPRARHPHRHHADRGVVRVRAGTFAYIHQSHGGDPIVVSIEEGELLVIKGDLNEDTVVAAPGLVGWQPMRNAKVCCSPTQKSKSQKEEKKKREEVCVR